MDNLKEARGVVLGALAGAGVIAMAICVAMGFAGCAWVDEMTHRTAEPDTRADIGTSRIEFNAISKRTGFGTTIDDYTCGELTMVCERTPASLVCRCEVLH